MQKTILIFFIISIVGLAIFLIAKNHKSSRIVADTIGRKVEQKPDRTATMKITSSPFDHNAKIPSKYTCDGENINPPLEFIDVPDTAKSLALIVDDPDAPSRVWVHWVVYNINPQVSEVKENSIPQGGIEGMTDFGKKGYGGPCPPPASPEQLQRGESGTHRYFFKLYALDTMLDFPKDATKQMVEQKMQGHILDKAELIGSYSRQ